MVLEIQTGKDNPILRARSTPILKFDKKLKSFVEDMKETMEEANGLGLAAPQVGVNERLFISTVQKKVMVFVNPEIISLSEGKEVKEEGCLSLPNIWGEVERSKEVTIKFQDIKGNEKIMQFSGLDARAIQHENDHLNAVLFVDKLHAPITFNSRKEDTVS